jgi:hypothetical protein
MALLEVGSHDVDELVGGLAADACAGTQDMLLHVVFEHLAHEAIERPARRCDALQDVAAFGFISQSALDSIDLSTDSSNTMQQFGFLTNGVAHVYSDSSREPRISYPGIDMG